MVFGEACVGDTPAAWMRPVTSPSAVAFWTRANVALLRDVRQCGTDLQASIGRHFGRSLRILQFRIREQDFLADADATRDRLTDGSCADDNDDAVHADHRPTRAARCAG